MEDNEQPERGKTFWIFVGIGVLFAALVIASLSTLQGSQPKEVPFSNFTAALEKGSVKTAVVNDEARTVTYEDSKGKVLETRYPSDFPMSSVLIEQDINVLVEEDTSGMMGIVVLIGLAAAIGLVIIFTRNRNKDGKNAKDAPGRQIEAGDVDVTFDDVAGIDEVVEELEEIKLFLEQPEKFQSMGANIPKGVLLFGPPGTGKTLLARAVAGEASVPFFSISGSDFVEMYVGVGASRVRKLFEQAKAQAPCVVFIDEIDAVGRRRSGAAQGGQEERENTLNQLLVEIDGFQPNQNVIVIAASNRADILDPALTRPGRFDRQVVVDIPDRVGRRAILDVHGKDKPFAEDVELDHIAGQTAGFCGADLANLVNEAALLAARGGRLKINRHDIEEATLRVMAGPRKNRVMSDREKYVTAVHEMGHAIIAHELENAEPVHKVTVVGRGQALGLTVMLQEDDKLLRTKPELMSQMAVALGGRLAEELIFDEITTGASNDLEKVSDIASSMVLKLGMADDFALRAFVVREQYVVHSDDLSRRIDEEVDALVAEARLMAQSILLEHREQLVSLSDVLMERETLDRDEFEQLMAGLDPAELAPAVRYEDIPADHITSPLRPEPDARNAVEELDIPAPVEEAPATPTSADDEPEEGLDHEPAAA